MSTSIEDTMRQIIRSRSERNKVAVPVDRRLCKVGHVEALAEMLKRGYLHLLDSVDSLPHLAQEGRPDLAQIPLEIYLFTDLAIAWERAVPMILHCPCCHRQHIDAPDPATGWTNPPHKSHKCQYCGAIWRPADIETFGVARIATRGREDTWEPPV
jgi:hypothetical protein